MAAVDLQSVVVVPFEELNTINSTDLLLRLVGEHDFVGSNALEEVNSDDQDIHSASSLLGSVTAAVENLSSPPVEFGR